MPKPSLLSDRPARSRAMALIGLLAVGLAGAVVAAAQRSGWGTVGALAFVAGVELVLARTSPLAVAALRHSAADPARAGLRLICVVLLAARCLGASIVVGTAVTAVLVVAVTMAGDAARVLVSRIRRLPLVTRDLDLGDFALPTPPPAIVMDPKGSDAVVAVVAALGLTIAMHRSAPAAPAAVGLAAATLIAAVPAVVLAWQLGQLTRANLRSRLTEAATSAVESLAPEVVLYFAATPAEIYQVRMWIEPIKRLGRSAVVILRSHTVFDALGDIGVPVICSPFNGTIASIPLPARVVALFVTHSGNNLSMLRRPEIRSVFVGHGDSDKPDSVNPFARVYDEVWVAGPLGRRRYAAAGVGVADDSIIEIGRPQIDAAGAAAPQRPTIVYAPTWEGWGDDPHHSSLAHVGPALVERLIARPDIQVRYRPHPLTGRRSPALRVANRRIIDLVGRVPEDESLAETFAGSSGLIGDVSSVISEYLPFDRPYAVVDSRGIGSQEFTERFPATSGGFVLTPDLAGLDGFVAAASDGPDPSRTARRELLEDALGDPATSQQRFADAVTGLLG